MAKRFDNKVAPDSEIKSDVSYGDDQSSIHNISIGEGKSNLFSLLV